jgi:HEAT repeat protein
MSRGSWVLGLVCLVPTATAQGPGSRPEAAGSRTTVAWEADFDQALARAKNEGKPLLFAFLMDDEPANDETARTIYTDPAFVELSRRWICVPCSAGSKRGADGNSASFAGVTVASQQANEKKARARYMKSDLVCTPQHVFCDHKGVEITRKVYLHSGSELCKAMRLVLAGSTKELDAETQRVAQEESTRIDKLLKDAESGNLEVRDAALGELGSSEDPRALPAVMQRTKAGNDEAARLAAIKALARKGNHKAVAVLVPLLADQKAPVVIQSAQALGAIQLPDAVPALLDLLKKQKPDRVRNTVLRAAARCNPESKKTLEAALAALKNSSTQMHAASIVALGHLRPDAKSVAALRPFLGDKNLSLRGLAVWALGNHGDAATAGQLEAMLRDEKSPEVRAVAERAIQRCRGTKSEDYEGLYAQFFVDYENY